jgi:hypothetical protein
MPATAKKRAKAPRPEPDYSETELVKKYLQAQGSGKRGYKRADRILEMLRKKIGEACPECGALKMPEVKLPDGRTIILADNHAVKDVVFNVVGCRRYELKIIEAA